MDIPLAYIIFDIMISLKKNNRDTMIYRDILIIYLIINVATSARL